MKGLEEHLVTAYGPLEVRRKSPMKSVLGQDSACTEPAIDINDQAGHISRDNSEPTEAGQTDPDGLTNMPPSAHEGDCESETDVFHSVTKAPASHSFSTPTRDETALARGNASEICMDFVSSETPTHRSDLGHSVGQLDPGVVASSTQIQPDRVAEKDAEFWQSMLFSDSDDNVSLLSVEGDQTATATNAIVSVEDRGADLPGHVDTGTNPTGAMHCNATSHMADAGHSDNTVDRPCNAPVELSPREGDNSVEQIQTVGDGCLRNGNSSETAQTHPTHHSNQADNVVGSDDPTSWVSAGIDVGDWVRGQLFDDDSDQVWFNLYFRASGMHNFCITGTFCHVIYYMWTWCTNVKYYY